MRLASWLTIPAVLSAAISLEWTLARETPNEALPAAENPNQAERDEQTLRSAGLPTDGPALVEFFRQRARLDSDVEGLNDWIKQLGDADPSVPRRAVQGLVGRGTAALPLLRRVINDLGDPELTARARRCIQVIEGERVAPLPAAAARLLAHRKPAGAVEVLLAYLPGAEAGPIVEDVAGTLSALAYRDGKPHPALLQALNDSVPLRRAVAGAALCHKDQPEVWSAVRKLLNDSRPLVRLRVAMALVLADDLEAVPALIDLLGEVPPPHHKPAEELLRQLAGAWAPNPPQSDDAIARRIRRDAWASWWRHCDSSSLLAEFRRRTLTASQQEQVQTLIDRLGDEQFEVRQRAAADLIEFGVLAAPLLRQAARGPDLERVQRAEECLREISERGGLPLPASAVHLLAMRKPAGALETLLDFVPFADNDEMSTEVQRALRQPWPCRPAPAGLRRAARRPRPCCVPWMTGWPSSGWLLPRPSWTRASWNIDRPSASCCTTPIPRCGCAWPCRWRPGRTVERSSC